MRSTAAVLSVVVGCLVLGACAGEQPSAVQTGGGPSAAPTTSAATPSAEPSQQFYESGCAEQGDEELRLQTEDGVNVYALAFGEGDTAVVLAHHSSASHCMWASFMRPLAEAGVRVYAFDFRRHGLTEDDGSADVANLPADVAAVVEQARADGAEEIVLLGGSMGGDAVARAAADVGAERLVLLSPAFGGVTPELLAELDGVPVLAAAGEGESTYATQVTDLGEGLGETARVELIPDSWSHGEALLWEETDDGENLGEVVTTFVVGGADA